MENIFDFGNNLWFIHNNFMIYMFSIFLKMLYLYHDFIYIKPLKLLRYFNFPLHIGIKIIYNKKYKLI